MGGFSQWHRQLIFTLAGFLNLVYTKHMKCILSRSLTCRTCSEKIAFDAATSVHQQRHSEEENRGLTFPTCPMVSGFLCAHMQQLGVSEQPSESDGRSLHQPKDCKWYFLFFLPVLCCNIHRVVLMLCMWTSISNVCLDNGPVQYALVMPCEMSDIKSWSCEKDNSGDVTLTSCFYCWRKTGHAPKRLGRAPLNS